MKRKNILFVCWPLQRDIAAEESSEVSYDLENTFCNLLISFQINVKDFDPNELYRLVPGVLKKIPSVS